MVAGSTRARSWIPYAALTACWFVVAALFPGPSLCVALVVSLVGLAQGIPQYRRDPGALLPRTVLVAVSMLAGSAGVVLVALAN